MPTHRLKTLSLTVSAVAMATLAFTASAPALAYNDGERPALVVTDEPIPDNLRDKLYSKPVRMRDIAPAEISGGAYYDSISTAVTRKISDLRSQMKDVQSTIVRISSSLAGVERQHEQDAAEYYASVATINTQLQSGTTPGNPRLVKRVKIAERNLEEMSKSLSALNTLSGDASATASQAAFLLEQTRAAYSLSGAVEEDHVRLAALEDDLNATAVALERVMNNISDDIGRTVNYINSERNNLRTLSLAVANGDLYGRSLLARPYAAADTAGYIPASTAATQPMRSMEGPTASTASAASPAPSKILAKIRFDRADVDFQQPVYTAVSEAMRRYPNAKFELIAINPTQGNAAEVAIESTRARRNAERVLRTLNDMGLSPDRVTLTLQGSDQVRSSEVHIYMR